MCIRTALGYLRVCVWGGMLCMYVGAPEGKFVFREDIVFGVEVEQFFGMNLAWIYLFWQNYQEVCSVEGGPVDLGFEQKPFCIFICPLFWPWGSLRLLLHLIPLLGQSRGCPFPLFSPLIFIHIL